MRKQPLSFDEIREGVHDVIIDFPIIRAAIFGSYARGDATAQSDLDVVVEPGDRVSLLRLIELQQALEVRLNIPVDIVTYKSLQRSNMDESIMVEARSVYEQD